MKDGIKQIIGKTIKGVVVKKWNRPPWSQVFLLFSDHTYYELYAAGQPGSEISGAGGVDRGGMREVKDYMPEAKIIFEAYDENIVE